MAADILSTDWPWVFKVTPASPCTRPCWLSNWPLSRCTACPATILPCWLFTWCCWVLMTKRPCSANNRPCLLFNSWLMTFKLWIAESSLCVLIKLCLIVRSALSAAITLFSVESSVPAFRVNSPALILPACCRKLFATVRVVFAAPEISPSLFSSCWVFRDKSLPLCTIPKWFSNCATSSCAKLAKIAPWSLSNLPASIFNLPLAKIPCNLSFVCWLLISCPWALIATSPSLWIAPLMLFNSPLLIINIDFERILPVLFTSFCWRVLIVTALWRPWISPPVLSSAWLEMVKSFESAWIKLFKFSNWWAIVKVTPFAIIRLLSELLIFWADTTISSASISPFCWLKSPESAILPCLAAPILPPSLVRPTPFKVKFCPE